MHTRLGWILGVTLLLGACGGESDSLPPQVRLQTNFHADPFPYEEADSGRAGGYTAISSSGDHTCGIRQDGSLWCWGSNGDGQVGAGFTSAVVERPARVLGEAGWERVSAGAHHTCGIRLGALFCWGRNGYGQLGDGTRLSHATPTFVARGGWRDVAAADEDTCAIDALGKLYCWGNDPHGTITEKGGDATTPILQEPKRTFRQVVLSSASDGMPCALEESGHIWCWDSSINGLNVSSETGWVALSLEGSDPCARKADGSLWCWVRGQGFVRTPKEWKSEALISGAHFCRVALDGSLWCSGEDDFGQLGNGGPNEPATELVQVGAGTDWLAVATGRAHSCALNQAGEVWCWGSDNLAQLGVGRARTKTGPQLVGANWDAVSLGDTVSCGTQKGQILCWGSQPSPPVLTTLAGSPTRVQIPGEQIAWNSYHTCTLDQGAVGCREAAGYFTSLLGPPFRQLSVGDFATCGIADGGALYCDESRALAHAEPQRLGSDVWQSVSVGQYHACGITEAHKLYCWGGGGYLGLLPPVSQSEPQAVTPERDYVDVAAGARSSCAIAADQSLWCWGEGYFGAVGNGSFVHEALPVSVGGEAWSQVSVGQHTCAIRADGALFCWGPNGNGQLGSEPNRGGGLPLQVGTATDWKQVAVGGQHTCAINQAKQLYCWGSDSDGQIGVQDPWRSEPARVWPL
ncbi:MAG: hypothetical protein SFV15_23665 [Polyangiaceae bacterium]|nr:hypothetical protein [Polyangiaceae bacterium]